jgi:hypothetical protein
MESVFEGYIESARGVLSEAEAEKFETQINAQQELINASAKMARSLFGGGDAP